VDGGRRTRLQWNGYGAQRAPTVAVAVADFDTMAALGGIGRQSATVVSKWAMGAGSVGTGYRVTI
jgi:hypothetical protein